jgi:hypothetical protein
MDPAWQGYWVCAMAVSSYGAARPIFSAQTIAGETPGLIQTIPTPKQVRVNNINHNSEACWGEMNFFLFHGGGKPLL